MTSDGMGKRAAIYTRISLDRRGESESPENQEAACRLVAAQRGWTVTEVFTDRDTSAYKRGVKRPGFDRLLKALRAGEIDAVLCWKTDRLTRQGIVGITPFLQALTDSGADFVSATEPFIDTSSPMGRGVLGFIASMAEQESENISTRVKLNQEPARVAGKLHGGGSRQFGLRQRYHPNGFVAFMCGWFGAEIDRDSWVVLPDEGDKPGTVVPAEAAAVREAIDRIEGGESLRQIAFDWNERGITTTTGGHWLSVSLGQMLRSPRLAGLRTHHGQLVTDADGKPLKGSWEPIITVGEHFRLLDLLGQRVVVAGRHKVVGGTPLGERREQVRRYLLTGAGVIRCTCGGAMRGMKFEQKHTADGRLFYRYQCLRQPGRQQCGKVAASMAAVDAFVVDQLLDFLAAAEVRPIDDGTSVEELQERIAEDGKALAELVHERFVNRSIPPEVFEGARDELQARVADAQADLERLERQIEERRQLLPLGDREALRAWWDSDDRTDEERRRVIRDSIQTVTIHPAKRRGGNRFDTGRVSILFNFSLYMHPAHSATPAELDALTPAEAAELRAG